MPDATANDSSTDSQAEPDGSADAGTDSEGADARGDASYTVCPPGITPSFRTILAQMLSTSGCGTNRPQNCHSASGASLQGTGNLLDFSADASTVYAELLGQNGTGALARNLQGSVHPLLEVVPGDASASYLYVKLQLPTLMDPQYGECMPPTAPGSVCPAAVDAVRQWIEQGAPAN
jgi:hypothetical protein